MENLFLIQVRLEKYKKYHGMTREVTRNKKGGYK
jgi:hypothetical protein